LVADPIGSGEIVMRVVYPKGSFKPSASIVGGIGFYANPVNLASAKTVTLEYKVFFPVGFDFVKGGKLPGLYGGHKSCSGGKSAATCFSTRFMWRTGGMGELYSYADQSKQLPALCSVPPLSICNPAYGISSGRGAFTFATGKWTALKQIITLNTVGKMDGSFNIYANGVLVISYNQMNWRNSDFGFLGIDFETFFGGSDSSWASPKEQFSYFKDFSLQWS
jgi:hypothetical protein